MNFEKISAYLDSLGNDWGIPACDLSIHLHGKEVYRRLCGWRDADKREKASRQDVYWLYSSSKLMTCTAALQLIERGVIALEDPVSKYLPFFADLPVLTPDGPKAPKRQATISDLFTMRSGLTYDLQNPWVLKTMRESGGKASTQELIRALAARGLVFDREPGPAALSASAEEFTVRTGSFPRTVAVKGAAVYVCGKDPADAARIADIVKDHVKITVYAGTFGGYHPMSPWLREFIVHWEAESYRSSKA